ncbi:MAG: hypothetical protein P1V21_14460 [Rhizobiaceae bacterium]|nr:hypothetical protein [Rhizobiaceae bacterium]
MAHKVPFKQIDISRAVKGATRAGMEVGRVEIDPVTGKIILVASQANPDPENDLDKWIRDNAG